MNKFIIYFTFKHNGDWRKIFQDFHSKEIIEQKEIVKYDKILKQMGLQHLTILDNQYPNKLKNVYQPPFTLFYKGDLNLLNDSIFLSIAGDLKDDQNNDYIIKTLSQINKDNNITLVTFSSNYTNKTVLDYFIKNNMKIIMIHPSGINENDKYFQFNSVNILHITEVPIAVKSNKKYTEMANRLISAISDKLIIYSITKNSNLNKMINDFLDIGKDIYAFPNVFNDYQNWTNYLIEQGAKIITGFA
ncbi:DNA-processing protein DprA [Mycoplasma phocoenae]|uniref:Smf/DprA SLOG domain-containing protein n=1 Tax=Mycoplasma phocoenae TaxID=754517 RepID=A0A858U6W4_9MOLU|nr:DNA-processing protein DprA [Mycoplasma phocoenae]QJG67005.1 hypothetical protein HGG69_01560 [Mycoplasma phocoenae]